MLRKINAILSLFVTILLMDHAIFNGVWMLSKGEIPKSTETSWIMVGLMFVHAIISIVLAILGHKGSEKRKCNEYLKLNIPTFIQRISGILLILFTVLHVLGTVGILQPPKPIHATLPILFFAMAMAHVAVSGSKALITLGIGNAKFIKISDIVIKLLCIVTFVADVIGFYLYLV